jgi:GntR family transcriptional regulator
MILFSLHPESGVPIYRQLVEQIRRLVAGGQLPPGAELPSVRELAQQHAVNPMTVSKAYALLEAEGLLERHRGKPMTVAAGRKGAAPLAQRMKQIDAQAAQLVTAARQLELDHHDLTQLIDRNWERQNGK